MEKNINYSVIDWEEVERRIEEWYNKQQSRPFQYRTKCQGIYGKIFKGKQNE